MPKKGQRKKKAAVVEIIDNTSDEEATNTSPPTTEADTSTTMDTTTTASEAPTETTADIIKHETEELTSTSVEEEVKTLEEEVLASSPRNASPKQVQEITAPKEVEKVEVQDQTNLIKKLQQRISELETVVKQKEKQIFEKDFDHQKLSDALEKERNANFNNKMELHNLNQLNSQLQSKCDALEEKFLKISDSAFVNSKDTTSAMKEEFEAQVKALQSTIDNQNQEIATLKDSLLKEQRNQEHNKNSLEKLQQKHQEKVQKLNEEIEILKTNSTTLRADFDEKRAETRREVEQLQEEKMILLKKLYHHAILAIKLEYNYNFTVVDLMESAIAENIPEHDLHSWIQKKLSASPQKPQGISHTTHTLQQKVH